MRMYGKVFVSLDHALLRAMSIDVSQWRNCTNAQRIYIVMLDACARNREQLHARCEPLAWVHDDGSPPIRNPPRSMESMRTFASHVAVALNARVLRFSFV